MRLEYEIPEVAFNGEVLSTISRLVGLLDVAAPARVALGWGTTTVGRFVAVTLGCSMISGSI